MEGNGVPSVVDNSQYGDNIVYRWFSRRHDRFPGLRIVFVPSGRRRCAWRVAMRRDWKNRQVGNKKIKKSRTKGKQKNRVTLLLQLFFFTQSTLFKLVAQNSPIQLPWHIFFFYFEMATSRTQKKKIKNKCYDGEIPSPRDYANIFGGEKKRLLNNGYSMKFSKGLQRVLRGRRVAVCLFTKVLFWTAAARWAEAVLEGTRR